MNFTSILRLSRDGFRRNARPGECEHLLAGVLLRGADAPGTHEESLSWSSPPRLSGIWVADWKSTTMERLEISALEPLSLVSHSPFDDVQRPAFRAELAPPYFSIITH